ncbi:MAG: hypothetical protein FI731_07905 [SAR202 cluster bacterium]|nr:hypothetical protein [SAR202 cluster bacterium]
MRPRLRLILTIFLLLAGALLLLSACGGSTGETPSPTTPPDIRPTPTIPPAPTGPPEEVTEQKLDILVQLAETEVPTDRQGFADYVDQVGSVLERIDFDPEVLDAVKSLLEDILGGDIELVYDTSRDMTPGFAPNAGMMAAPAAPGPFG